ncbi:tetratricopeptide repeat protein [bacterium]|nr:tetratricopeptide repeat protein [bacterium]
MDDQQLHTLYKEALSELSEGKKGEAAEGLQKILKSGYESSDLYYYLGRAYLEAGNPQQASLNLIKSSARDRFNLSKRKDLAFAQNKVQAGLATPLKHPYEIAQSIASYIRPSESLFLGALIFFSFAVLKYLGKGSTALKRSLIGVSILLTGISGFSMFHTKIAVLTKTTKLHEAPLENSAVRKDLVDSTRVIILRSEPEFSEIERGNLRGWVKTENLLGTLN